MGSAVNVCVHEVVAEHRSSLLSAKVVAGSVLSGKVAKVRHTKKSAPKIVAVAVGAEARRQESEAEHHAHGRSRYKDKDHFYYIASKEFYRVRTVRRKCLHGLSVRTVRARLAAEWKRQTFAQRSVYVQQYLDRESNMAADVRAACLRALASGAPVVTVDAGTSTKKDAAHCFLKDYWCLLTWNNKQWVWAAEEVLEGDAHTRLDLDVVAQLLRQQKRMQSIWDAVQIPLRHVCESLCCQKWTASFELCPRSLRTGTVRLHLHVAVQRTDAPMVIKDPSTLNILGTSPQKSQQKKQRRHREAEGDVACGQQAGAAHLYCSKFKRGQVCMSYDKTGTCTFLYCLWKFTA